jgi:hypothetical protein
MIRHTLAALALTSIVGCSASTSINPFAGQHQEEAVLAAYAARTPYPSQAHPEEGRQVGALINAKNDRIEIINFSDKPLHDVNVWVNGTFLYKVDNIPSQSTRAVSTDELYDTTGKTMSALKAAPTRVEVQTDDKLWSLRTAVGH